MPKAKLRYQYTVTTTLLKPQGGIEIEATKEFEEEHPGFENQLQGLLEQLVLQITFPDESLARVAERVHNFLQQVGGNVHSVLCRRGAQLVTVYLDKGN